MHSLEVSLKICVIYRGNFNLLKFYTISVYVFVYFFFGCMVSANSSVGAGSVLSLLWSGEVKSGFTSQFSLCILSRMCSFLRTW